MDVLGLRPGDEVVIEASATHDGAPRTIKLRAHHTPELRAALYQDMQEPSRHARFSDCAELLAVSPDLPILFPDAEHRRQLGIAACAPVRVRASRRDQWSRELRDPSLLLVLAVAGAISLGGAGTGFVNALVLTTVLVQGLRHRVRVFGLGGVLDATASRPCSPVPHRARCAAVLDAAGSGSLADLVADAPGAEALGVRAARHVLQRNQTGAPRSPGSSEPEAPPTRVPACLIRRSIGTTSAERTSGRPPTLVVT